MKKGKQLRFLFNGSNYNPERDNYRLFGQLGRIWETMKDGKWRTLNEISMITRSPESSVSAQLRHLRKKRFGSHFIDKRYEGNGLYEYKLIVNEKNTSVHKENKYLGEI